MKHPCTPFRKGSDQSMACMNPFTSSMKDPLPLEFIMPFTCWSTAAAISSVSMVIRCSTCGCVPCTSLVLKLQEAREALRRGWWGFRLSLRARSLRRRRNASRGKEGAGRYF
eukprot:scaffold4497_cov34-Tisochrysis_lutea.AAC.2